MHELVRRGVGVVVIDDLSSGRVARLRGARGVRLVVADVARPGRLGECLAKLGPFDVLVHLAARVGVRTVLRDPEGVAQENLAGVERLIEALAALPAGERPRVLAASSSEVYAPLERPLREDDRVRSLQAGGRWRYAAAKLRGERMLDEAGGLFEAGRGPVHLRLFNVVGPGQDSAGGMVLATFVEAALAGRPIPVHGDGGAVRTFAHVDEVARTLAALALDVATPAGPLNVGGRARASVLELAEMVRRQMGARVAIERVDPRRHHGAAFEPVRWREPDLTRLVALGVPVPAMPLAEIVADTVARHPGHAAQPARRSACASPAS